MQEKKLYFESPRYLHQLYGGNTANLSKVEATFSVQLVSRENWMLISGDEGGIAKTEIFFLLIHEARKQGLLVRGSDFQRMLDLISHGKEKEIQELLANPLVLHIKDRSVVPQTLRQKVYLEAIAKHSIVFGIGPAGTGKTYLAMAAALQALVNGNTQRVILTRPAVEAGEALGFLPGNLSEKILPYLRPLYDALFEIMGKENAQKLIDHNSIEIAPLAYMRGRTLSNAFVILDEAQNASPEQILMFLTRLGEGGRMVINGDLTQIDLPYSKESGLAQANRILGEVNGIAFCHFEGGDVVRHFLVERIIQAYEDDRSQKSKPHQKGLSEN